jgi:hypothetical protein
MDFFENKGAYKKKKKRRRTYPGTYLPIFLGDVLRCQVLFLQIC